MLQEGAARASACTAPHRVGTVVDIDGRPVPFGSVRESQGSDGVEVDAAGRFSWRERTGTLLAEASGQVCVLGADLAAVQGEMVLVVTPARMLRVQAMCDDLPVPDAAVSLRPLWGTGSILAATVGACVPPTVTVITDSQGAAVFPVAADLPYELAARAGPDAAETRVVRLEQTPEELVVRVDLHAGRTIRGWVADAAARPLAGARVRVLGDPGEGVQTDARGCFELIGRPVGVVESLVATHPGWAAGSVAVAPGQTDVGWIRLPAAYACAGTVVDPGGTPVGGREVRLEARLDASSAADFASLAGAVACTDDAGEFVITGLAAGTYRVGVPLLDDMGTAESFTVHVPAPPSRLCLAGSCAAIEVGAVDSSTGQPVRAFECVLRRSEGNLTTECIVRPSAASDTCLIRLAPDGETTLGVRAPGFEEEVLSLPLSRAGRARRLVFLKRLAARRYWLVDESGVLVRDGELRVSDSGGAALAIAPDRASKFAVPITPDEPVTLFALPVYGVVFKCRRADGTVLRAEFSPADQATDPTWVRLSRTDP